MNVLGIETSCDETSVAVVTDDRKILSNIVSSQLSIHQPFGGVVPEIAARRHLESLESILDKALQDAKCTLNDIDAIAATTGPGLIGGVMVGMMMGKTIAAVHNLPFLSINHLMGHALTVRLTNNVDFPFLLLLVSGGHTQLLVAKSPVDYELLGSSLDDAVGEAFDKTAKLLNLPYPGGPSIETAALNGNDRSYILPRPLLKNSDPTLKCSFSFSGLKTAVREIVLKHSINPQFISDVAACFQKAIADILINRTHHALEFCKERYPTLKTVVVAGGVAANQHLRSHLESLSHEFSIDFIAPPLNLCTDNAAVIAWAGIEKLKLGLKDPLDVKARPRWPLTEVKQL